MSSDQVGARPGRSFAHDVLYLGLTSGADRVAAVDMFQTWTWRDVWDAVHRVAEVITAYGLPKRSRILLSASDSLWHQIVMLACGETGMIFVPVNARATSADIEHAMTLTRPAVGLIAGSSLELFAAAGFQASGDTLGPLHIVTWADSVEAPDLSEAPSVRTPLLITLTSGSTAAPKPVLYSVEGESAVSRMHSSLWRLNTSDVVYSAAPFSWIYGLSTVYLASLVAGSRSVMAERFKPELLCDVVEGHGVTVFVGVTTHFRILLDYCEKTGRRPFGPELRMAVSGAERRDEDIFHRFEQMFDVPVLDLYASSEVRPGFGYDPVLDPGPVPGSCGRIIAGVEARLEADEETPDSPGQLFLRSPGSFMGYFDPELLVKEEVTGEDWIAMGDLFDIRDGGWGYVLGRSKDIIIRGGANISPVEVEALLGTHPAVREVAVVGLDSGTHGEAVAAAIVGDFADVAVTEAALTEHCSGDLPKFKIPTEWVLVPSIPRNANAKVDKAAVRALFADRAAGHQ